MVDTRWNRGASDPEAAEEFGLYRLSRTAPTGRKALTAGIQEACVQGVSTRSIEGDWPYVWLDATHVKVRQTGRIVSVAMTIAVGVNTDGRRENLGLDIGVSEAETFWTAFLRKLVRRGLRGAKLVVSDAHQGLKAAIAKVLGATWQRYRVHFIRNALAHAGRSGRRVVGVHRHRLRTGRCGRCPCPLASCRRPAETKTTEALRVPR